MGISKIMYSILLMIMLTATCEAVLFGGVGLVNGDVSSTSTIPTAMATSSERTPSTQPNIKINTTIQTLVASDKTTQVYADNHSPVQGINSMAPTVMVSSATKKEAVVAKTETSLVTEETRKPTTKQFSTVSFVGDTPETTTTSSLASSPKKETSTSGLHVNIPTKQPKSTTVAERTSSNPTISKTVKAVTKKVTPTTPATTTSAVAPATTTKTTKEKVTTPEATATRAAETPRAVNSTISKETATQVTTSTTTRNDNSSDKGSTFSKNMSSQTLPATPRVAVSNNDSHVQHVETSTDSMVTPNASVAKESTAAPTINATEANVTKTPSETNNHTSSAVSVHMFSSTSSKAHAGYLSANTTPASGENSTDVFRNSTVDPDRLQFMYTDDDTSDSFWPVVMALTIVIPSVVVFGVTITVLYRRRMAKPRRPYSGDYDQM